MKSTPKWLIILGCLFGMSILSSLVSYIRTPKEGVVHVDNSLSTELKILVDGVEVGRVFPNVLVKIVVAAGTHTLAVRNPAGAVQESIEVTITTQGRYIYNPGASREYELMTAQYSPGGLLGGRETRTIVPARWHDIDRMGRIDHVFEGLPDTIYVKSGERATRTQLTRRMPTK